MSLLILDAMNIIRRIHEAIGAPDREVKAADTVKSSLSSFKRALKTHRPTHAVAVFVHGGRTRKHDLYEGYQVNRKPMPQHLRDGLPIIKRELHEMGLHWISIEGIPMCRELHGGALARAWNQQRRSARVWHQTDFENSVLLLVTRQRC